MAYFLCKYFNKNFNFYNADRRQVNSSLSRRRWTQSSDAAIDDLPEGHSFHLAGDVNMADEFESLSRYHTWPQQHQAQDLAPAQSREAGARPTTSDSS